MIRTHATNRMPGATRTLVVAIVLGALAACAPTDPVEEPAGGDAAPRTGEPSAEPPSGDAGPTRERLTVSEAAAVVRERIFEEKPGTNPEIELPLGEITTDDVWEETGAQLFQVTAGPKIYKSYVVHDGRVREVGEGIGGYGVVSMCAADLDGDDAKEIAVSYSWGSGIHRSHVGYVDVDSDAIAVHVAEETCFRMEDLMVGRATDGRVEVRLEERTVGHLVARGGEPPVRLAFAPGVDAEILKRGW